ncbi:hypothetical protein ACN4EK_32735 [Pantanalinema rosaneae CENA516]|uniref:hypothetical protein n=1 Tax=Pantanalinema rosaneae TaxID=1620701 RepID=UPI003D6FDEEF
MDERKGSAGNWRGDGALGTGMTHGMLDVTAIILTKDSAPHIGILLDQYERLGIAPRALVDSKTTDDTFAICHSAGVRTEIVENSVGRVGPLIGKVADLCDTGWILRFDDDELPSRQMLGATHALAPNPRHVQYH